MRPLISYDDITTPQSPPKHPANPQGPQPPQKKRKTVSNQRQGGSSGGRSHNAVQHWDDPGTQGMQMNYDDAPATASGDVNADREEYYEEEEGEEESRELTYGEIWDDSALIDAWNSAAAEYEAYHGPGKKWKQEPVKKSPLWYNVPPATTSKNKPQAVTGTDSIHATGATAGSAESDSTPLNFDTFVPTHDPSLTSAATAAAASGTPLTVPGIDSVTGAGAEGSMVTQDEAFSRAMTAMYWSGYWTAIYHCRRNEASTQGNATGSAEQAEVDAENEEEDEDEDMLPAQR